MRIAANWLVLASCTFAVSACGGSSGGTGPGGHRMVSGTARVVHGASAGSAPAGSLAPRSRSAAAAAPASGYWGISPDQGKATIDSLIFKSADGTVSIARTANCSMTYTRGASALTSILDCPFQVQSGTYVSLDVAINPTFQLLISDVTNGFFSDPSSATKLSVAAPAGGAQFVSFTAATGGGPVLAETYFPAPIVVDSAAPPTLTLVVDMIHTVFVTVSGTTLTFDTSRPFPAIQMMASTAGVGRAEYYTPTGTAFNAIMSGPTSNDVGSVRVFYAGGDQPTYLYSPIIGPSSAWAANPNSSPHEADGFRAGGYLGIDAAGTLCWAVPTDFTYSAYTNLRAMAVVSTLGASTTLITQTTASVPAPVSGNTYASGCPAVTAGAQTKVWLVAR